MIPFDFITEWRSQAPPTDDEILRGFLGDGSFVITGPPKRASG